MSKTALNFSITLTTIHCGQCGGIYALNDAYREQKQEEGGSWNCPYCKVGWGYSGNGENARLKRELAEERIRKERALAEANVLRIKEAKLRKRVSRGVCPCCTRSFVNLQRHMKTKHPEQLK